MLFGDIYEAITNELLDPWNIKFSMKVYDKHCTNCICNIVLKLDVTEMGTTEHRVMSDKNNRIRVMLFSERE